MFSLGEDIDVNAFHSHVIELPKPLRFDRPGRRHRGSRGQVGRSRPKRLPRGT